MKPIYRRVEELPLRVCDVGSTVPEDRIRLELRYPDRLGEITLFATRIPSLVLFSEDE
jgi:hypothetical protein